MQLDFIKMNGAGNDFIIFDARKQEISLSPEQIKAISARDNKITNITNIFNGKEPRLGCDQLLILRKSDVADVEMTIYNADGGEVDACGNATRCIVSLLENELNTTKITIKTNANLLKGIEKVIHLTKEYIIVDMGKPSFQWNKIPLAMPIEEAAKKIETFSGWESPIFVNMGNPHVVFFLEFNPDKTSARDLSPLYKNNFTDIGYKLELYKDVFPEGVNVSIAILGGSTNNSYSINSRVWERGVGVTKACGTAACAIIAAANKLNADIKNAHLWFEDSLSFLSMKIEENGHILLGGPVEKEFTGTVDI